MSDTRAWRTWGAGGAQSFQKQLLSLRVAPKLSVSGNLRKHISRGGHLAPQKVCWAEDLGLPLTAPRGMPPTTSTVLKTWQ